MANTKLAIIDNNADSAAALKKSLLEQFKGIEVSAIAEPAAPVGFDVFIIAANMLAGSEGDDLIVRIKNISPGSLVLAYSDDLSIELVKQLMAMGCGGAFIRDQQEDSVEMFNRIESYMKSQKSAASSRGIGGTVTAISALIREWNTRIERNGRAYHRTFGDA